MIRVTLTRDIMDDRASQGVLRFFDGDMPLMLDDEGFLYTLELPWLDNKPMISCIPAGEHRCRRKVSPTYGETFEIEVEGRTHILFHWGNWVRNTNGCVLLGLTRDPKIPAVWHSKQAHNLFMETLEGVDEFMLTIYEEAV